MKKSSHSKKAQNPELLLQRNNSLVKIILAAKNKGPKFVKRHDLLQGVYYSRSKLAATIFYTD